MAAAPDRLTPDILAFISLLMSLIAFLVTFGIAARRRALRVVFGIISAGCLYMVGLYAYILLTDPDITSTTAAFGRAGVILLFGGIVMLSVMIDRWFHVR